MTETKQIEPPTEEYTHGPPGAHQAPADPPAPVRYVRPQRDTWSIHGWRGLHHALGAIVQFIVLVGLMFLIGFTVAGRVK